MKKYYIGGRKGLVIFFGIWILFVLGMFISIFSSFMPYGSFNVPVLLVMCPMFLLMISIVLVFAIREYNGIKRMNYALNGHKGVGKVDNLYIKYGNKGSVYYTLEVIYKNDNHEETKFYTYIDPKYQKYFTINDEIPLYINGEYAFYKIDEVKNKEAIIDSIKY